MFVLNFGKRSLGISRFRTRDLYVFPDVEPEILTNLQMFGQRSLRFSRFWARGLDISRFWARDLYDFPDVGPEISYDFSRCWQHVFTIFQILGQISLRFSKCLARDLYEFSRFWAKDTPGPLLTHCCFLFFCWSNCAFFANNNFLRIQFTYYLFDFIVYPWRSQHYISFWLARAHDIFFMDLR